MPTYTSSAVSTFITHLRLLNLDQLEDWPVVTEELFAPKHVREHQKQRIRCVEWALYRLFEKWNPKDTRNKLQPFFPPYESLRSLNLRAALFRCLNDLKKDGLLGKETVIRKSMSDDCRGDRFEELLSSFSTLVLQKIVRARPDSATTITGRLVTRQKIPRHEQGSLLPLAIAHQGALKALLERKKRLKEHYTNLQQVLEAKEQELLHRVDVLALADAQHPLEAVSDRAVQEIRHHFDENWQGNRQWIKSIVEADTQDVADPLLDTPFPAVWSLVEDGTISQVGEGLQQSLVQDLTKRVRVQQDRLSQWQSIQQDLIDSRPKSPSKINGKTTPYRNRAFQSPLKFNFAEQGHRHDDTASGPISPEMKMQHRQLLDYSHRKTKSFSTPGRKLDFKQPRREWVDPIAMDSENQSQSNQLEFGSHTRTLSIGGKNSVDEQLDPASRDSPLRQKDVGIDLTQRARLHSTSSPQHVSSNMEPASSDIPLSYVDEHQLTEPYQASPTPMCAGRRHTQDYPLSGSGVSTMSDVGQRSQQDVLAQQIIASAMSNEVSPVKPKSSLTERTRQSMAFSPIDSLLPDPVAELQPLRNLQPRDSDENQPIALHRSSSLAERTRQSMSLLPTSFPSKSSHPSHNRRQSRQYPTNQFETPRKQLEDLKEMTPPDILFSPEADYASVFKSRPKIATSPSLSPTLASWHEGESEGVGSGPPKNPQIPTIHSITKMRFALTHMILLEILLTLNPCGHSQAAAAPTPQLYHHCLDPKHKMYQFCCETKEDPDCDGIHGPKNPLKPGTHDSHWEEGPPPEEEEEDPPVASEDEDPPPSTDDKDPAPTDDEPPSEPSDDENPPAPDENRPPPAAIDNPLPPSDNNPLPPSKNANGGGI
ncbi:MAG: hypothetical protein Q9169_006449 [Polycauliona sp. 2 TL-2023]